MGKITTFLLFLLLGSNAYAYCYANQWASYGPVFSSLGVNQGTSMQACQQLACQIYPGIPECGMFLQPACSNSVEYQSTACSQPHTSGVVNSSRTFNCTSQSWSAWTITSNNCTQDPPTCHSSISTRSLSCQPHFTGQIIQTDTISCPDPYGPPVDSGYITTSNSCAPDPATCSPSVQTQTLACPVGYNGSIIQNRSSSCADPYSTPTWTLWSTTSDTCTMTATNINNPVSPISPISPTNPNSVISQQMKTAPIAESVTVQDITATAATPSAEVKDTTMTSATGATSASSTTTSSVSSSAEKKDAPVASNTPKGKEIVPGFGIVMSMQLLRSSYDMQQQAMQEYINLEQENEYGRTQEFSLSLLSETAVADRFDTLNRSRWANLLRNNALQRLEWGN